MNKLSTFLNDKEKNGILINVIFNEREPMKKCSIE
jgi:hypothetical protein